MLRTLLPGMPVMRRIVLAALAVLMLPVAHAEPPHPELAEADIATLQQQLGDGSMSSVALTQAYLDRIAAIDDAGPHLDAVIELNPHALAEAKRLDQELSLIHI